MGRAEGTENGNKIDVKHESFLPQSIWRQWRGKLCNCVATKSSVTTTIVVCEVCGTKFLINRIAFMRFRNLLASITIDLLFRGC